MSDLLLMGGGGGLPRNGLVLLADPFRDAYGLEEAPRLALQTGVDYSGRGNSLTYGATTNASTDDPVNTGTAWVMDGADYIGAPLCPLSMATDWAAFLVVAPKYDTSVGALFSFGTKGVGDAVNLQNCYLRDGSFSFTSMKAVDFASSSNLALTTDGSVVYPLLVQSVGGTITIKRLDTMASSTCVDKRPTTDMWLTFGAARMSAAATVNYSTGLSSFYLMSLYQRGFSLSEQARLRLTAKSLMAGRGVTVA
jgi:hypothetical protein